MPGEGMSKNVYILNEYVSSTKNGIGTYVDELLYCLKSPGIRLCLIIFNSPRKDFFIERQGNLTKMYFPVFPQKNFADCSTVISRFFRLHIADSPENIFFINHFPLNELMKVIKMFYPLSQQVYVIHDMAWTGILAGDEKKLKRMKRQILQPSEQQTSDYLLNLLWKEKEMLDIADKIVCLSADTCSVLTEIYTVPRQKIHLIPNGLRRKRNLFLADEKKEQIRYRFHLNPEEKILLFVGRSTNAKGFNSLMCAFRQVLLTCPMVRLVIAGTVSAFVFPAFHDIASRVIYTGHIDRQELAKWYQIAAIGVIPSYSEQCSYVGIEMMMYGLPVVASDGFGVRNMFFHEINALIASIGQRNAPTFYMDNLAGAIKSLLASDDALLTGMRIRAKERYAKYYSIRNMKKEYRKLIMPD